MKHRNPFFVAAFPYLTIAVGYIGLVILSAATENSPNLTDAEIIMTILCIVIFAVGLTYTLYWQVATAHELRAKTDAQIPNSFLLLVPIANYWWQWRYSQAVEKYTDEKQQAALVFLLIAVLGSIGLGITQDMFNKHSAAQHSGTHKPTAAEHPTHPS